MKKPIATILKAQGIKGEVKMASSVDVAVIKKLRSIYIDGKTLSVRSLRTDGKFLYVLLEGIEDRNSAEDLRNKTVYADAEEIELPNDTFFIDDIIGCKVIDTDGNVLGELTDVYQNGVSADVFIITTEDGKSISFPFIKRLNTTFDKEKNVLTVDARTIKETALYED